MKNNKLLTGNIHATSVKGQERDAISKLRDLLPKLSKGEVAALAIVFIDSQTAAIGRRVSVTAIESLGRDLTNAILQAPRLSDTSKLTIAIELLTSQVDPKEIDEGDASDLDDFDIRKKWQSEDA